MSTLTLSLPDDMKAFVDAQAIAEGHASADEYLRALVRQEQKRKAWKELETKLLEGMHGPSVVLDREEWDAMERETLETSQATDPAGRTAGRSRERLTGYGT